jgi:hypothetical protein
VRLSDPSEGMSLLIAECRREGRALMSMVQGQAGRFWATSTMGNDTRLPRGEVGVFEDDGIDRWTKQRRATSSKERRKRRSFV